MAVHNSSFPTTSLPTETITLTVAVPDYGGSKKREAEQYIVDRMATDRILKSDFPRMLRVLTISSPQLPLTAERTLANSDRELQKTSHHSRKQSSIREEITYRQTDCWG